MGKSEYALSDNDRELYRPFSVVRQLSPASATALEFFSPLVGGFAWWAVCVVGGLRGWRFARLAVCAIGGLRVGRFAQWAVSAVDGLRGLRLAVGDLCLAVFARAHVHLQTRLRISGMAAPIVLTFGFLLGVHIPISQVCTGLTYISGRIVLPG